MKKACLIELSKISSKTKLLSVYWKGEYSIEQILCAFFSNNYLHYFYFIMYTLSTNYKAFIKRRAICLKNLLSFFCILINQLWYKLPALGKYFALNWKISRVCNNNAFVYGSLTLKHNTKTMWLFGAPL